MTADVGKPGLTDQQRRVLGAIMEGRRVVAKASAGSGKTRTLVEAYCGLVGELQGGGNPYDRVLAITFTNEAAYNLKKAIFRRSGGDMRALLSESISTIHSFCNSVLASNLYDLKINPDYEILDEGASREDAFGIIDDIVSGSVESDDGLSAFIEGYGYDRGENSFREALYGIYSAMRKQGISVEDASSRLQSGVGRLVAFERNQGGEWASDKGPENVAELMASHAATLSKYLLRFWGEFDAYKKSAGRMTYDDILCFTLQLLKEHPRIRERYRNRYEAILVDEFQDTDRIQFEIISMIARDGRQAYVGDLKQSIYEWRYADPSIMDRLESSLAGSEGGEVVELTYNFRSTPELISFFNILFRSVFDGTRVSYTAMRHANELMQDSDIPATTVLSPGGGSISEMRQREAEMISSRIVEMCAGGPDIIDVDSGGKRMPALRDIAILFRSKAAMPAVERELRRKGIPFIRLQSDAFFEKDEIVDVLNYLSHLADPSDDFFTFTSLRSPLFGCSDDTLLSLAASRFDFDRTMAEAGERDAGKLALFRSLDDFASSGLGRYSHMLLTRVISETRADLVYLASAGGKQAYANLLRLVDMVRGMERDGPLGMREVVQRLRKMASQGAGSPEYPLSDEKSDAVRLMTVHSSKGLEFPVVFVADSGRTQRNHRRVTFFHADFGIVPGVPGNAAGGKRGGMERLYDACSEERRHREEEEDSRIFYVAATRARQFIFISRFSSRQKDDRSWSGRISRILPEDVRPGIVQLAPGCRIAISEYSGSVSEERLPAAPMPQVPMLRSVRLPPKTERLAVNATSLANFMVCPHRSVFDSGTTDEGEGDSAEARARGTAVHGILEDYDYGAMPAAGTGASGDSEQTQLQELALRFVKSSYGEEARRAWREGTLRREMPFLMRRGVHLVRGKIDLVAGTGNRAVIVDYKTGRLKGREAEYVNQLMIYALAHLGLSSEAPSELVLFGLERQEEKVVLHAGREEILEFGRRLDAALEQWGSGETSARPSPEACTPCPHSSKCRFSMATRTDAPEG